jgi:hypothetical protein
MRLGLGTISALKLGTVDVQAAYLGAVQVYSALDPDAAAYIAAVEAADGQALEPGVKAAYDAFVRGCKADGIWNALKASCIMAGARTLAGALVPLVGTAPTNNNFVSDDYNRVTGLKGDGSTKYLDSNRNNNADSQNSKHMGILITEQNTTGQNAAYIGHDAVSGSSQIVQVGNLFARLNSSTSAALPAATEGFIYVNRDSSTELQYLVSGSAGSINNNSASPVSAAQWVFARSRGLSTDVSNARLSFYSIGEALDLESLDTRTTALMTAIEDALT